MGFLLELQRRREQRVASLAVRTRLAHVFVLSAWGLFVELLLIRWLDAQVRPLAYVKNLPLIAAFLGLGIGYALSGRRRSLFPLSVVLLSALLLLAVAPTFLGDAWKIQGPAGPESNLGVPVADSGSGLLVFYGTVGAVFALVVLATLPIGQVTGTYMSGLAGLRAYTMNVAGSLVGILSFGLLNALYVPPYASAALALGTGLLYLGAGRLLTPVSALLAAATCVVMGVADHHGEFRTYWSPYNRIQVAGYPPLLDRNGQVISRSWLMLVQHLYYQRMLDLRPDSLQRGVNVPERARAAARGYDLPYRWKKPGSVLIVGAGTGNDVAAAIRHGVERIDAVEIDPLIVRLGREKHPEHPYDDPRVRVIVDDARAFLKRPGDRYDMIVFGLLDSHSSTFSSISNNIRLDNYVYTLESLETALGRLAPDGILALSLYCEQHWIVTRMEAMLREAWGRPPLVVQTGYDSGVLYFAGGGVPVAPTAADVTIGISDEFKRQHPAGPPATDAWPFLYLAERTIPPTVAWASLVVLVVAVALVLALFRGRVRFDRHLFFLGAGFLLVETRTIAQLGLLFGTVWRVSALTIALILAIILLANRIVEKRGALPRPPLYLLLALGLVANYLVPTGAALGAGLLRSLVMAGFLVLPLFFAGLIFASSVRERGELPSALASNLVGAVLGGVLENLAMLVGFPALSLVAIAVYAASFRR